MSDCPWICPDMSACRLEFLESCWGTGPSRNGRFRGQIAPNVPKTR